ncbi:MAG: D-alanyl-D-alanine carboxypeptidase [Berkelbacteria bacterium GW2011_GWA2_35_9]|uniref:D-alanyl-D-alanine carboxypeptidase n=1 Tax=Berkelbacteria bacterium GW2011_GWA2_35_9 TaxID=1618333 RepID=A0A0G0GBY3_9BACT|nr:MAG: D-alanyl-D-alanine carboxypeptidase [Berkelbacteria bacterium GW2011_GWA2_35_9]
MSYILPPKIEKEKSDPKTLFYKITAISVGVFLLLFLFQKSANYISNKNNTNNNGNVLGVKSESENVSKIDELKNKLVLPPIIIPGTPKPIINAKNYILVDQKSAEIIVAKDEYISVPVASITKLMTAVLTMENGKLDDIATVSKNAVYTNGSTISLAIDEKISIDDLLNALLINSANDSAIVLAEHISGSEEKFVELMNSKAKDLRMNNTNFLDPAGLNDEGKSSAHDIATLLSYALRFDKIKSIIKTSEKDITSVSGLNHHLVNSNRLVKEEMFFSGIIGGKTGFTPTAGHNLVSAAERDGHILIAVIINTFSNTNTASAEECKALLEWGYNNLKYFY